MITINGLNVVSNKISEFTVDVFDIDAEQEVRNARGNLIRDRITVKRTLSISWSPLTNSEISSILNTVTSMFFTVNYPDPLAGSNITKTFTIGNRTAPMLYNGLWQGLSFKLTEQ